MQVTLTASPARRNVTPSFAACATSSVMERDGTVIGSTIPGADEAPLTSFPRRLKGPAEQHLWPGWSYCRLNKPAGRVSYIVVRTNGAGGALRRHTRTRGVSA